MIDAQNKLFIVGSGPGDPELLTIKAYKAIKNAQVILFDNLINDDLLHLAPKECITCYVGKKPYGEYVGQENINELIVSFCSKFQRVVRLKGGDPYIFGRGFEEWLTARAYGIDVEYIPGISSMQGAGMNAIPLTHRDVSEGVWAMTGMKRDGSFATDLSLAVRSKSTVVIYMGMRKLHEIARAYVLYGKGDMPVAVIQNASLPQQRVVQGAIRDLAKICEQDNVCHPAIIVIGEVVNMRYAQGITAVQQYVI
ncbi:uroporphyrinogen-III C-methyltransferase [Sphingobacterium paludis]|uniref:uroporphyrinogen-III C-methyltransferase n=1 Tax=Sphingobacterium paludis TaxID=1476465 RepID=A0A4V3E0X8_9SPHI|nr:uroporphyrinogen-III C-methyltransferase [Sphingobacterium paludis]TDS10250.1 uroporphyrin-III C-methyltransferase [Sphingobacterium paludis]